MRRSAIGERKFVKGLISGEDTLFVNKLFINKPLYGVLKKAVYFYRKIELYHNNIYWLFLSPINRTLMNLRYYSDYLLLIEFF